MTRRSDPAVSTAATAPDAVELGGDDFDELRNVAPDDIADDIDVILAAQEERAAGGEQEEVSDTVSEAEERIGEFEDTNCSSGE